MTHEPRVVDPNIVDAELLDADLRPDPNDPVQGFDEVGGYQIHDLDIDALDVADANAYRDQAIYESDLDEASMELDTPSQTTLDAIDNSVGDVGELYGVQAGTAQDRDLPDGDASFDEGQNWLEALETSSAEYGPEPEADIDPDIDDELLASETRDTPVADRGSGGPAGT